MVTRMSKEEFVDVLKGTPHTKLVRIAKRMKRIEDENAGVELEIGKEYNFLGDLHQLAKEADAVIRNAVEEYLSNPSVRAEVDTLIDDTQERWMAFGDSALRQFYDDIAGAAKTWTKVIRYLESKK